MPVPVKSAFSVEGKGEPLFLIHGIGASRASFAGLVPFLKNDFRCISYDLRGHGASPKPQPPYTLDDLVEDLEALRKELGIEKAHFAGHSLGGMIGPAYARKYPQHVLTLGLYSTAAFRTEDDSAKVKGVVAAMRAKGIPQVLETLKDRWFTPEFGERRPEVISRRMQQVIDTDPDVFLSVFDIYAETEMSPRLHEISHPCLVLTGENDGGCNPRLNRQIAAALPNSELVILPVLRHAILLEAADQVAPPVLDFLRRNRGKA
ncbi:alpha/beta fold hydrolase [Aestuariivirga sp.]|uniref:alpha/beta fold hydrolase n=1 Tax=Aestuariivirga sp. TaxID=2650926 RepID=UPI00391D501D